jgi:hypothetical protein
MKILATAVHALANYQCRKANNINIVVLSLPPGDFQQKIKESFLFSHHQRNQDNYHTNKFFLLSLTLLLPIHVPNFVIVNTAKISIYIAK